MLVFSRRAGEAFVIFDDITITIIAISGDKVRIGIEAAANIPVNRKEVWDAIQVVGRIRMEKD